MNAHAPMRVLPIASLRDSTTRRGEVLELDIDSIALGGEDHFKPERIVLSDAAHWTIRSIAIDGREQVDQELPGTLFSPEVRARAHWLDTLKNGSKLHASAVYQGEAVGQFRAALLGVDVPSSSDPRAFSGAIRFRDRQTGEPVAATCDGPDRVLPGESAWFVARPQCVALRVEGIILDLACEEWRIEDIHVHGKSQFAQTGPIPGDVFSPNAVDNFILFDTVQTAMDFAIKATYRGTNARGRFFGATCACLVAR